MLKDVNPLEVEINTSVDDRAFWLKMISAGNAPSKFNQDYQGLEACSSVVQSTEFKCNQLAVNRLLEIADNEPSLVFTLLCANLSILLYKYTGDHQITFGVPSLSDSERVNIMPITTQISPDKRVSDIIQTMQASLIETYKHQHLLFSELLKEVDSNEVHDISSFIDIIISLGNIHPPVPSSAANMNLRFDLHEEELSCRIFFQREQYKTETIEKIFEWLDNVLVNMVSTPNEYVSNLVMLSKKDVDTLLTEWGSHKGIAMRTQSNHQVFEGVVKAMPNSRALICGSKELTYDQLNQSANALAGVLIDAGIGTDDLIGVFCDRSVEMIIGVLGVLKSGGAYVPFDASYPTDRIKLMLDSAGMKLIVAQKKYVRLLNKLKKDLAVVVLEEVGEQNMVAREILPMPPVSLESLCYVIFTSGSTGVPKCTGVFHKGWSNLLDWFNTEFAISSGDKSLLISSFGFDITQRALMMPLVCGAELHLYNRLVYDPTEILDIIEKQGITILNCTPSTFYPLVEMRGQQGYSQLNSLRYLFLGGEPIAAGRLKAWATSPSCNCKIVNVYGVTECADVSSFYSLTDFDNYERNGVPIGTPIYNTELYILNDNLDIVPIGVEGELFIGGAGVGKGYINDPLLSLTKFIANPFATMQSKMYRTGDVVKYRADGVLTYAGRRDYQVKIRGHRVDLGEVESVINAQSMVKEAIVLIKDQITTGRELHCYFIPNLLQDGDSLITNSLSSQSTVAELWKKLRQLFPSYMIPDYYCLLKEMPLNPNGKIDRTALVNVPVERVQSESRKLIAPVTPTEMFLAELFKKVLNLEKISITDDFFQSGGHSLTATQLVAQINESRGLNLRVVDIIPRASIQDLAKYLDSPERILHASV